MIDGIAFSRRSRGYYPAFVAASAEYAGEVGSLYLSRGASAPAATCASTAGALRVNQQSSILALTSDL